MGVYEIKSVKECIFGNSYVGRGIVIGKTQDSQNAVFAYFIMGRSRNSRNRTFIEQSNGDVTIYPYDYEKVEDPSLIIYSPIRNIDNKIIVTNGDQTDTIFDFLKDGKTFEEALETRCFEPDAPNFTPRISGIIDITNKDFSYKMSILKSADQNGSACNRYTYSYETLPGLGHFIHTYQCDGNPVPTFCGEPKRVSIPNDIDELTSEIWENLNFDNKISLYVRYINLDNGKKESRIINKYSK